MSLKHQNIEALREELASQLDKTQIHEGEMLALHTTFKVGGPADLFIEPSTLEELAFVLKAVKKSGVPLTVLGYGSNVLVRDGGIRGVVVNLCKLTNVKTCRNHVITMGAGFLLKDVSEFALANSLSGLEFAVGIPGSLGGAVFMNAGAYSGEMKDVVTKVTTVDLEGQYHTYDKDACNFAYRHSCFQDNQEVIAQVEMTLEEGRVEDIQALMDDLTARREAKQPLEYGSAGSTFKRPEGYFAGTLIDQTGLKGFSVGDAEVSTKHAGFVINKNKASAKDVLAVIEAVQEKVLATHGVRLEPEVRMLGEDK